MTRSLATPTGAEYSAARQRRLQRVLRMDGVLTRHGLYERSHAGEWDVDFELVLQRAIDSDRVRRLTDDLFEAGPAA